MNRRNLFRLALAGAVAGLARHLPMPPLPKVQQRHPFADREVERCVHGVPLAPLTMTELHYLSLRPEGLILREDGKVMNRPHTNVTACPACKEHMLLSQRAFIEKMNGDWFREWVYNQ